MGFKKKSTTGGKKYTTPVLSDKDYQKRQQASGGGMKDSFIKAGIKMFKPAQGPNRIRIIGCPVTAEKCGHFGMPVKIHRNVGPDKLSYLSLKFHKRSKDPIDELRSRLLNDGKNDQAKEYNYKNSVIYWIIDRNDEKAGPQLWIASEYMIDGPLIEASKDEDTGKYIAHWDTKKGRDVKFTRKGQMERTQYLNITLSPNITPLSKDSAQVEEWTQFVAENPIEDMLVFYDYAHIKNELVGGAGDEDDEDAEDSEETKPKKGKSGKKAAKDDDDEDEEESSEEDDEDSESEDDESDEEESDDEEDSDDDEDESDDEEEDEEESDDEDDDESDDDEEESDDEDSDDEDDESDDDESEDDEDADDNDDEDEDSDDDDDESEDEDEEDEESDDDEKPAPAKRGRGRPPKAAAKPEKSKPVVKKKKK